MSTCVGPNAQMEATEEVQLQNDWLQPAIGNGTEETPEGQAQSPEDGETHIAKPFLMQDAYVRLLDIFELQPCVAAFIQPF